MIIHTCRKTDSGQILMPGLFVIAASVAMTLAVCATCMILKARGRAQAAADAAALTAASVRALGLNRIGYFNALLGIPVQAIGTPGFCWWPKPNTHFGYCLHIESDFASRQKQYVEGIIQSQEWLNAAYSGAFPLNTARKVAVACGAKQAMPTASGLGRLGLTRVKGRIRYWKTMHLSFIDPVTKKQHRYIFPIDWLVGGPKCWYARGAGFGRNKQPWVVSMSVPAPFSSTKLVRIQPQDKREALPVRAIASARSFNRKGPMFPDEKAPGSAAAGEYLKAAYPGWMAQIVPVGAPFAH